MDSDKLWGLGYGLSLTSFGGWAMDSDKLWGLGYGLSLTSFGGWAMDCH